MKFLFNHVFLRCTLKHMYPVSVYQDTVKPFSFLTSCKASPREVMILSTSPREGSTTDTPIWPIRKYLSLFTSSVRSRCQKRSRVMLTFDIYMQTSCNNDSHFQKTRNEIARYDIWRKIECCHSVGSYGVIDWDLFQS
jgi:hypothetical protein